MANEVNVDLVNLGLAIIGLFVTILFTVVGSVIGGVIYVCKIDKSKVSWEACQHMRETCPCVKELNEVKEKLNK